jgi:hypothetical protein
MYLYLPVALTSINILIPVSLCGRPAQGSSGGRRLLRRPSVAFELLRCSETDSTDHYLDFSTYTGMGMLILRWVSISVRRVISAKISGWILMR